MSPPVPELANPGRHRGRGYCLSSCRGVAAARARVLQEGAAPVKPERSDLMRCRSRHSRSRAPMPMHVAVRSESRRRVRARRPPLATAWRCGRSSPKQIDRAPYIMQSGAQMARGGPPVSFRRVASLQERDEGQLQESAPCTMHHQLRPCPMTRFHPYLRPHSRAVTGIRVGAASFAILRRLLGCP